MKAGFSKVPIEAFISHSSENRKFVEEFCDELKRHGVRYWYSTRSIAGAKQWHDEIGKALQRCDWFVLIVSPQAVKADWVKHELIFALNDKRYKERIVPCIYRKSNMKPLSWTLAGFQSINFTKGLEQGMPKLLGLWGLAYQAKEEPVSRKERRAKRQRRRRK